MDDAITELNQTNESVEDQADVFMLNFNILNEILTDLTSQNLKRTHENIIDKFATKNISSQLAEEILDIALERKLICSYRYAQKLNYKLNNSAAPIIAATSTTAAASALQWVRSSFRGRISHLQRPKHDALSRTGNFLETNRSKTGHSNGPQQCIFVRGHNRAGYCVPVIETSRRCRIKPRTRSLLRLWFKLLAPEQTGAMQRVRIMVLQNCQTGAENNLLGSDEMETREDTERRKANSMQDMQRRNATTYASI